MDFGNEISSVIFGRTSERISTALRPFTCLRAAQ